MRKFIRIDDVSQDERTKFFADLLPEEVTAENRCRLIGAVDDNGIPEGMVAFRFDDNLVSILHVEVYEELRRRGIGTALIQSLLRYLAMADLPFMVEAVYSVEPGVEGEDADAFFTSLPEFAVVSGGKICTVTTDTVWDAAGLARLSGHPCSVESCTELSNEEKNRLLSDLKLRNLDGFIDLEDKKMIPDLSLFHVEKGRCTTCVILTETDQPDTFELSFLMSDPAEKKYLAGVLDEVIRRYRENYPDHNLVFSLVTKESELLAQHLFTEGLQVREILTAVSFGEI